MKWQKQNSGTIILIYDQVVYQFEKSVSLSLSKAGCKLSCTGFDKLNLTVYGKEDFKLIHYL